MKNKIIIVFLFIIGLATSAFSSNGISHEDNHGQGAGHGHYERGGENGNGYGYGHSGGGGGTPEPATILLIAGGVAAAFGAKKIKDL